MPGANGGGAIGRLLSLLASRGSRARRDAPVPIIGRPTARSGWGRQGQYVAATPFVLELPAFNVVSIIDLVAD